MKKLIFLLLSALLVLTSCGGGDVSELSQDTVSYGEQSEVSESDEVSKGVSAEESVPEEESEVSAEDTTVPEESEVSVPDETSKESEEYIPEETSKESDVSESEKTDAAVDQALKLIEEGKIKESYEILYKSGTNAAKEMLKDFVVVYTKNESLLESGEIDSSETYTYDENGFLVYQEVFAFNMVTEYTFINGENGKPVTSTQVMNTSFGVRIYEFTHHYNEEGLLIRKEGVSENGKTLHEYEYDSHGNEIYLHFVSNEYDMDTKEYYKYDYDSVGNITNKYTIYDLGTPDEYIGSYYAYFYDNEGKLIKKDLYYCNENGEALDTTYEYFYNELGLLTASTYTIHDQFLSFRNSTTTYSDYLFFYRPQK